MCADTAQDYSIMVNFKRDAIVYRNTEFPDSFRATNSLGAKGRVSGIIQVHTDLFDRFCLDMSRKALEQAFECTCGVQFTRQGASLGLGHS